MARQIGKIQKHRERWRIRLPGRIDVYVGRDGRAFRHEKDAIYWLGQIQGEIAKGTFDIKFYRKNQVSNRRFAVYAEQWLNQQEKRYEIKNLSAYTIQQYRRWVTTRFIPFFGTMELQDIKGIHITNFYCDIAPGIKEKTRFNILGGLHKLLNDAVKQELINVIPNFPPEYSKSNLPDPVWKWADVEEQDKLLSFLDDNARYFCSFLMRHPVRPSEGRALQHRDIDLGKGLITIRQAFSKEELRHTKTKKINFIPIDGVWAATYLARKNPDDLPTAFVFTHKGKPLPEYWARNKLRYARKHAGLPELNLYAATRHSFASQAHKNGARLEDIKDYLGHTDIRTTQRYTHVNVDRLRALQRRDNVVSLIDKKLQK